MGVRISVFAPFLCGIIVSGLGEYADGCRIQKGAEWYPFLSGGGTGRGVLGMGGPLRVSTQKANVSLKKKQPPE